MQIYCLPTRNDVSAPHFDEDNPHDLETYFEELEYLFQKYSLYDATERKRSAVRYVSVNVRELWQCAVAWDDHTRSYDDFKAEVYTFYPEVTDAFRYTPQDLDALVNERAQGEMQGVKSLGAFYRKFMVISTFLVKRDRLSTLEQTRRFLDALSGDQAVHLQQRLESKYPNALSMKDVLMEAQLLLPQLYSAHATETLASEAPRHPEKRNATMAREPTATASTISHSTSSAPSFSTLAVPLTPDTALDPCRNDFSTSATIPAAASTSQAACEPPSCHPSITEHTNSRRRESSANDSHHTNIVGSAGLAASGTVVGSPVPPFSPVEVLVNRWAATVPPLSGSGLDDESPEMMERKIKALMNKLTMERFDSISDQIIAWVNRSGKEKDGRTLIQLSKLIFEKATDEATFSDMYARLCRKMVEQISPKVQDDSIKNAEGKPFAGGQLFRRHLLIRCQEDFERGWVATGEMATVSAAARAAEAQAVKGANEKIKAGGDSELYSDEDYAAANAKRRRLGLIHFIGELFKSQILTERILHECIKKLLSNVENPQEEEVEALCTLLWTVGSLLDTVKARAHIDVYFSRMREWTKNKYVNEHMISMLQVRATVHCISKTDV
jgi:MIF4G domain